MPIRLQKAACWPAWLLDAICVLCVDLSQPACWTAWRRDASCVLLRGPEWAGVAAGRQLWEDAALELCFLTRLLGMCAGRHEATESHLLPPPLKREAEIEATSAPTIS